MSAEQTRFDWKASDSAPVYFDMKIIFGNLRYYGDPNGAGLYVPSGGRISHGWGLMRSSHNTGVALKPLPDKLDITFFSYLEDQFYHGSFDLPYDKILKLFQEEEAKPKRKTLDGEDLPNDYMIIVGVAPGGSVAVWMRSQGTKELFFGKAEKIEMDFSKAFGIPIANKAERTAYVNEILAAAKYAEEIATIQKNGIPFNKWANYRILYHWVPTFAVSHPPNEIGINFYTGEGESFVFPLETSFVSAAHPIPARVDFSYAINGQGRENYYIVRFDENEIFDAFTRLSTMKLPLQLEFTPTVPIEQTQIRLHNTKESVLLKKFTVKRK